MQTIMSRNKIKILVVSENLPMIDQHSGDRRFVRILCTLSSHYEVTLFIKNKKMLFNEKLQRYRDQITDFGIDIINQNSILATLAAKLYDIILFEFYKIAEIYLNHIRRFYRFQLHTQVIIDSVDVHFLREESGKKLGVILPEVVAANKIREINTYKKSDAVIVVTKEEKESLREVGIKNIFIVPNIVELYPRISKDRNKEVLFIGGFLHPPNVDGLIWFAENIWKKVYEYHPDARLTVIGSNPTNEIHALANEKGVEVLGFVQDTLPYLDRAMVSIAPLRYGGGMKGKVNEALAHGVPVVATSFGAQGLDVISGKHLIVADEPEVFGDSLIYLLDNPEQAQAIGVAGQQEIAIHYTPMAVESLLTAMIQSLHIRQNNTLSYLSWRLFVFIYHCYTFCRDSFPKLKNGYLREEKFTKSKQTAKY